MINWQVRKSPPARAGTQPGSGPGFMASWRRRSWACATPAPRGCLLQFDALYGPFRGNGVNTAPGNFAFGASLRAQNPECGVHDTGSFRALAGSCRFGFVERIVMPASNLGLVFRRRAA
jgi:hypothetical protein